MAKRKANAFAKAAIRQKDQISTSNTAGKATIIADDTLSPELFERAWAAGIAAVADERIDALRHLLAMSAPTIERYRSTEGELRQAMDQVLETGLSKLQGSGEVTP